MQDDLQTRLIAPDCKSVTLPTLSFGTFAQQAQTPAQRGASLFLLVLGSSPMGILSRQSPRLCRIFL